MNLHIVGRRTSEVGRVAVESGVGRRVSGAFEAGRQTSEVGRMPTNQRAAFPVGANRAAFSLFAMKVAPIGRINAAPSDKTESRINLRGPIRVLQRTAFYEGQQPELPAQEAWV